jgi:HAD superfamily hydrolase (TIGR01450 family)
MTWILDLDGVVWLADRPIPGAADAVAQLREWGERVVFVTNNSSRVIDDYRDQLTRMGIPTTKDELLTSAQAAASMLEPGSSALVCGGPGVDEALTARGVETVTEGKADAVVVGWHRDFDYSRLAAATTCVLGGARLIGTNDDATYPTGQGPIPGAGSILAAVAYASGTTPTVAGKPHDPVVKLLAEMADDIEVLVGDRPSTDGLLARRLGVTFGLVLTGVTRPDHGAVNPAPDVEAPDLITMVAGWAGLAGQAGVAGPGGPGPGSRPGGPGPGSRPGGPGGEQFR